MADDLDRKLRHALDGVRAPDLWSQASSARRPDRVVPSEPSRVRRAAIAAFALALFVGAILGVVGLWSPSDEVASTSSPDASIQPGSPIAVSGLVADGQLRCEASFPSSTLTPGEPTGVRFQVTNVTDSPVTVRAGTNGDAGWLSYRVGNTVVADTASVHYGIFGPAPMERAVDPGASFTIGGMDPPVRWGGSLTIVPMCMNRALPPVYVTSIGTGAPSTEAAVTLANEAIDGRFDACLPPPGGSVTGSFPIEGARCESSIRSDDGFDVVTLVAVLPPSAPAVPMDELATTLAAVPMDVLTERDVHYGINWWVVVVTSGSATQVYHGAVSHCGGTFSAGGNGVAHCSGQG